MIDNQHLIHKVSDVVVEAESSIENPENSPLTESAFNALKERVAEYILHLISESIRTSKRGRTDIVSASDVLKASEYLYSGNSRRIFRHLGTIGGIFFGASISNVLSMLGNNQINFINMIMTFSLGIIGIFLIAIYMAKE